MGRLTDAQARSTLVNGDPVDVVPCTDRALAYGDGLFETIALIDAEPQHWSRHFARLTEGAARLFLSCPPESAWCSDIERLLAPGTPGPRAVLKLLLSRGRGRRGYAPDPANDPTRITQLAAWPGAPGKRPFDSIECDTPLGRNPALAGLKHLNRLEQVLGAREVAIAGAQEGIMWDVQGNLIEGTRSNLFLVIAGELWTPLLTQCGVAGVMRSIVLERAAAWGIPTHETDLSAADLARSQGLFFTNSLLGVQPVRVLRLKRGARQLDCSFALDLHERLRTENLVP